MYYCAILNFGIVNSDGNPQQVQVLSRHRVLDRAHAAAEKHSKTIAFVGVVDNDGRHIKYDWEQD